MPRSCAAQTTQALFYISSRQTVSTRVVFFLGAWLPAKREQRGQAKLVCPELLYAGVGFQQRPLQHTISTRELSHCQGMSYHCLALSTLVFEISTLMHAEGSLMTTVLCWKGFGKVPALYLCCIAKSSCACLLHAI